MALYKRTEGYGKLIERLNRLPRKIKEAVEPALVKSAEETASVMRQLAPVDEGDLRASIAVTGPGQRTPKHASGGSTLIPEGAAAVGLTHGGDVEGHVETLRRFAQNSGLRSMVYEGKLKAGCQRSEEVRLLQEAGIPSGALCRSKVRVVDSQGRPTGEHEERFCPFYAQCPAIQQRQQIPQVDVVFLVRNFLSLAIPPELKHPRGVVIDERFFDLLVHTTAFDLKTLKLPRRVKLTKKEREAGLVEEDILWSREKAVEIATAALKAGRDVAHDIYEWRDNTLSGAQIVADAKRACGASMSSLAAITPDMDIEQIREMCARPTGTQAAEEYRFWKIVEERVTALTEAHLDSSRSVPDEDRRIALLQPESENPRIRISWRTDPNWVHRPTLILDASVDDRITSKILGGREIVKHAVPATLNMRVLAAVDRRLSIGSFFIRDEADPILKAKAAEQLHDLRVAIATICAVHGNGHVLIALPLKIRRAIELAWTPPVNADFVHDGAVAGLDFAKSHVAVVAISRTELPLHELDGLVAALAYDEPSPELPIDPLGTGEDDDGKRIYPTISRRTILQRDGSDVAWDIQEHAGEYARRIQRQYREEEFRQKIGRARPIFRADPVAVYAITQSLPEDLIVDELCSLQDMPRKGGNALWDAMRLTGGVVDPHVLAMLAPHYGCSEDYEVLIQRFLVDVPSVARTFHRLECAMLDGTRRTVYVTGTVENPRPLWEHMAEGVGCAGEVVKEHLCRCVVMPAAPAPIDHVEEALGERHVRIGFELEAMQALRAHLIKTGEWRPERTKQQLAIDRIAAANGRHIHSAPAKYRCDRLDLNGGGMPFGAWLALDVLKSEWVRGLDEDSGQGDRRAA